MPGSRKSLRRGDFGLKNGPSVSGIVGSSPSWQEGVGERSCAEAPLTNTKPEAAKAPVARSRRRVGNRAKSLITVSSLNLQSWCEYHRDRDTTTSLAESSREASIEKEARHKDSAFNLSRRAGPA